MTLGVTELVLCSKAQISMPKPQRFLARRGPGRLEILRRTSSVHFLGPPKQSRVGLVSATTLQVGPTLRFSAELDLVLDVCLDCVPHVAHGPPVLNVCAGIQLSSPSAHGTKEGSPQRALGVSARVIRCSWDSMTGPQDRIGSYSAAFTGSLPLGLGRRQLVGKAPRVEAKSEGACAGQLFENGTQDLIRHSQAPRMGNLCRIVILRLS